MIEVRELGENNFEDFICLLQIRGETPNDFFRWKLIDTAFPSKSSGFIAYENNNALGCIGKINKILVNRKGSEIPATWFCDWFILPGARGTGSGKKLMTCVGKSANIGLGIPGPVSAQAVAARSGYKPLPGFVEIQVSLQPWRVGYKRYNGSIIHKIFRGVKEITDSAALQKTKEIADVEIQPGFPPIQKWLNAVKRGLSGKAHFQRDDKFLTWFRSMPLKSDSNRSWWYHESDKVFVTGFTETDIWGLRRTKVVELISFENSLEKDIKDIFCLLKKSGADLVVMLIKDEGISTSLKVPARWLFQVPVYITATAESKPDYLSLLDKESSWRDFSFG